MCRPSTWIHGADEVYSSNNYNPGGKHTEEHHTKRHHEGTSESETGHHSESAAKEKKLAVSFSEFVAKGISEINYLAQKNMDITHGGMFLPDELGFDSSYQSDANKVNDLMEELLITYKALDKILKNHSPHRS